MTEGPPRLVADPAALAELLDDVRSEPVIALDTESNSFHVYRERVCLLQISTRAADFVVDPLAVDVTPLGAVLCDGRETVLHGADYDVRCLKREYGWRFPRLFDTMAAARRLGRPGLGLSALVEQHLGAALEVVPAVRLGAPAPHARADRLRRAGHALPPAAPRAARPRARRARRAGGGARRVRTDRGRRAEGARLRPRGLPAHPRRARAR